MLCLFILGCEKNFFDFRKKYVGDFDFTVKEHSVYGATIHDTTYINEGKIENGSEESSVLISLPGFSLQSKIYNEGSLEGYYNNNGRGEFSSKKDMEYTWGGYSPGGSVTYTIIGTKK